MRERTLHRPKAIAFAGEISLRFLCRALPVVLTLSLLVGIIAAQTESGRLLRDAQELYDEGSKTSLETALEKLQQARPLFHSASDALGEANAFIWIGRVHDSLGEKQQALASYLLALPLTRAVANRRVEAMALNNIGLVYDSLGERQKALDTYFLALPLTRAVNERRGEAVTLNNIGRVYDDLGEKQKALEYYAQALPISRAVGDRSREATTLNNIGRVYDDLGEKQKALDYFALSLPLSREVANRSGEATTLNNIGMVLDSLGEKQKALDNYALSLPLYRAVGNRSGEAVTLSNIGAVYNSLGELQKALDNYAQALPLHRAVGNRGGEALALNNIGLVYVSLGEPQKALENYAQALPLHRAVGNRSGEAITLNNIGLVYFSFGEKQKALEHHAQALLLWRAVGDRSGEATALNNIGRVYDDLGEKQKALDNYALALPLYRAVGNRGGESLSLFNRAWIERDQGKLATARASIEAAIVIIETLRTKITNQELRSSYFATVQNFYELYIDILMRLHSRTPTEGHDGLALQVSERARARALLDTLAEANADIHQGVDPALLKHERALQARINAKAEEQTKLQVRPGSEEQANTIAGEIESLTSEFQKVEAQIRQVSPRYAALTQPQPLTLKQIQTQVLDSDTVLLEYSLGEKVSYLWAVTPDSITSYQLPKRKEIEDTAREVYALLISAKGWSDGSQATRKTIGVGNGDATGSTAPAVVPQKQLPVVRSPEALVRLSRMVLGPVSTQLNKRRVVVVADGALQFIPFAALSLESGVTSRESNDHARQTAGSAARTAEAQTVDSGLAMPDWRPLIVDHEIISLPSASTLAVLRQEVKDRKPAQKTLVVLADPVFGGKDERVAPILRSAAANESSTGPLRGQLSELPLGLERSAAESGLRGASLPRLPGTRAEANEILSLVERKDGMEALDFAASRETATSGGLSQYRYVHFATHGFLNSLHPELSGLALSMFDEKGAPLDGFLRAHEIFNLKLTAELVVLSACQTGLGKEIRGEGLVGLTRGFMYAGAPRVVVSLWSVSDKATAELMSRFYRGLLRDNLRPAAALRAAQVSLMKEPGWESPFYWAPFTLQGEWR